MIQRILRPLWFLLLFALMLWPVLQLEECLSWGAGDLGLENDPGAAAASANDESISIGGFIKDTMNPWVFAIAFVAALVFGRAKGMAAGARFVFGALGSERTPIQDAEQAGRFLSASKALAAAGRGLLWGSVLLGAYYVSGLPWASSRGDMEVATGRNLMYVIAGGLVILVLGPLFLLPLAKRARALGQSHSEGSAGQGSRALEALDLLMCLVLLGLSFLPVITAFQAKVIESSGAHSYHKIYWPVIEGVSKPLAVWSLVFVTLFAGLALLPNLGAGQGRRVWRQYGHLCFISGVLGVSIVLINRWREFSQSGGGQANYAEIQHLAGTSLTPLFVGVMIYLATRFTKTKPA